MKCLKSLGLVLALAFLTSGPSYSDETGESGYYYRSGTSYAKISSPDNRDLWVVDDTVIDISEPDGADVFIDFIPRFIFGIVGMTVGTAAFVVTVPFTGLATAFRPHNAIHKSVEMFVVEPVRWTFQRPIGVGPTMPGMSDGNVYGHFESRKTWKK